jgi:hypothetical protein
VARSIFFIHIYALHNKCVYRGVRPAIGRLSSRQLTIFDRRQKRQQSTSTLLAMPRGKGKANYKVDTLVMAVEELLPNGAQY